MRTVLRKIAALVATSAVVGAGVAACSHDVDKTSGSNDQEREGTVGLNLHLVNGIDIDVVTWTVTQGPTTVDTGDLPVDGPGTDFAFGVPLPVGAGYSLSLEAVSTNGNFTCTGGYSPFDVAANTSTPLMNLTLTCTDVVTGQIVVSANAVTEGCPDLTFAYAVTTPFSAPLPDGSVRVRALANDLGGAPITYTWSAPAGSGTFDVPTSGDTRFNCDSFGVHTLTVEADNGECNVTLETAVSCFNVSCGNGVPDVGESCDPNNPGDPLAAVCPVDCTFACGDNIPEANEACDFPPSSLPAGTDTCDGTCQLRTPVCGDGFITAPETCDTAVAGSWPAGGSCSTVGGVACQDVAPAACGNGVVEAGETCDPSPSSVPPGIVGRPYSVNDCGDVWGDDQVDYASVTEPPVEASGGALDDCNPITPSACATCETATFNASCTTARDCSTVVGNAAAGSPAAGTPKAQLCNEVLDCMRDTHCAGANAINCYCGTASSDDCDAGLGNGECRQEIERALETTTPTVVYSRFTNGTFGGGRADFRMACDIASCSGACAP